MTWSLLTRIWSSRQQFEDVNQKQIGILHWLFRSTAITVPGAVAKVPAAVSTAFAIMTLSVFWAAFSKSCSTSAAKIFVKAWLSASLMQLVWAPAKSNPVDKPFVAGRLFGVRFVIVVKSGKAEFAYWPANWPTLSVTGYGNILPACVLTWLSSPWPRPSGSIPAAAVAAYGSTWVATPPGSYEAIALLSWSSMLTLLAASRSFYPRPNPSASLSA